MNTRSPLMHFLPVLLVTLMTLWPSITQAADTTPTLIYGEQKPTYLIGVTDATVKVVGEAWWGATDTALFSVTPTPTAMVALTAAGSHITAVCPAPTSTVGVQFLGDQNDGWAKIVVNGEPRWQGNIQGGVLVNDDYIEITDLPMGSHQIQVETMTTPTTNHVGHVTVVAFGCGSLTTPENSGNNNVDRAGSTDSPSTPTQTIYLPTIMS